MKVLWFANTPCNAVEHMGEQTIGGGWLQTLDLRMQEKVDLHVAFYANWKEQRFRCRNTTYHVIPPDSIRKSTIRNIFAPHVITSEDAKRYLQIIDEVKPDLVHVHGTENAYGQIIPHVKVPVVVSLQGIITPYAHRTGGDAAGELSTWVPTGKGIRGKLFTRGQRHNFEVLKLMGRREAACIAGYRHFIGRTSWDRRVSSVLSPGSSYFEGDEILREVFYSKSWSPRPGTGRYIIHTTCSDHPMKGFTTIVEAIPLLRAAGIDLEWRVAGLSEESDVVRIAKKMFGKRYPASNIRLLGRIGAVELANAMAGADLFVLPSYMENSPNSLCEAMVMGMPCVATNGGGTPSMLEDNVEGLLVQPRDPWAMSGAILEMIKDRDRAAAMGTRASARARKRHEPQRIVEQVYSAYQKILA